MRRISGPDGGPFSRGLLKGTWSLRTERNHYSALSRLYGILTSNMRLRKQSLSLVCSRMSVSSQEAQFT